MRISKSLIKRSVAARICHDGIVLIEVKHVGGKKYGKDVKVSHIFKMSVSIRSKNEVGYIEFPPKLLLAGVPKDICVTINSKSLTMEDLGEVTDNTKVYWELSNGAVFHFVSYKFTYDEITVNFQRIRNPGDNFASISGVISCTAWKDMYDFYEVYE